VFTATWNLNTKILTPEIVRKCFSRVEDTKASILVFACHEVEDSRFRQLFPNSKRNQDVHNVVSYFHGRYSEYRHLFNGNHFLLVMWDPLKKHVTGVSETRLFRIKMKGAMSILLDYLYVEDCRRQQASRSTSSQRT